MGSSLEGWKYSETRITTMPRGIATAPMRVVMAASPPTCQAEASRASILFPFARGPHPPTIRLCWWRAHPHGSVPEPTWRTYGVGWQRELSFRESATPEARSPRRFILGNLVYKGSNVHEELPRVPPKAPPAYRVYARGLPVRPR